MTEIRAGKHSFIDGCGGEGNNSQFEIRARKLSEIEWLQIWIEDNGHTDRWFVHRIEVECNKKTYVFPFFKWFTPNHIHKVLHLDTSLPQNDPRPDFRRMELSRKRDMYKLFVHISGIYAQVIVVYSL